MSLSDILRLLARKWLLLVLVPVVLSVSTFFFTRNLPKTYASDTTIYTGIASGINLSGAASADYNKTNNAFDNLVNLITARSTKEEVVYRLLATHLWQTGQQPSLLTTPQYESLPEALPAAVRRQLTAPTLEATLANVRRYAQANTTNPVYQLINSAHPIYSLAALTELKATHVGSSDLVRLEFEGPNPETCRYTLDLVTQVFLEQSRSLREGQTSTVTAYYQNELEKAKDRLTKAENALVAFNRQNGIINYEAQSTNIATGKETLAGEMALTAQQYEAARASLQAVNQKLGGMKGTLNNNRQVLAQRERLNKLNAEIADLQLSSGQDGSATRLKQLQDEADRTAQNMQRNVDTYYTQSTTTEGLANKELLDDWVQNMVQVEASRARLSVMNRRKQEFDREYQRMAPLGGKLTQIQREIELAEKAYLSTLASLNDSRVSQQNTQVTSNLKIIDPPNLPTTPKSNKSLLLVLLSGVGGFVFAAGLVIGLGMLDTTLKNPTVAARRIGLPVAGMMLDAHAPPTRQLQASQQRSLDQLARHILLKANTSLTPGPFVVGVFSVQRQEGKTMLCQSLAQRCHEMGIHTLALYPDGDEVDPGTDVPSLFYPSEAAAVQGWPLDQLIQNAVPKRMTEISSPNIQVVLVEFPALRDGAVPAGLLRQLNLVFLTVPANRAWRLSDHQTVEHLRATTSAPVEVVLSGVAAHYSEAVG